MHARNGAVMDDVLAVSAETLPCACALQDANEYIDVSRHAVPEGVAAGGVFPEHLVGIGVDFTASTVLEATQ